jgi:sulfur-oxidizing protein SoxY
MGVKILAAAAAITAACTISQARAEESEASRAARWQDVAKAIFPGHTVMDANGLLQLDAPPRALDAALVPVTITAAPQAHVVALTLVVDDNPAPVAGTVHFGPLADPHLLKLRVRVDQYTLLHAVAQLDDGRYVSVARFIKAAGGCSAPGIGNQAEARARMGQMRLTPVTPDAPVQGQAAQLLISHPNANGMQMDPVTRLYTPARYVQTIRVTQAGQLVFSMDGDISLAQDPAITFAFHPVAGAPVDVEVDDSAKAVFKHQFAFGS